MVLVSSSEIQVIAPSLILFIRSGIIKSTSNLYLMPSPLQSGQEPYGALKEKSLGSNSGREKSQSGQA